MANYSLVIDSAFKPFSYQEMLAPTLMATQAHQELENQYGELEAKASIWEEMANEQTDPYAYKMYKTYANDLREQADQLAREGLNATSRSNMLNMRARYSKEITPIEQAYTARQKQAEQQQQALLQNPTLMFSRNAASTSLDKYLKNPQLTYESYSGALLAEQVGKAAAALAKELRDTGETGKVARQRLQQILPYQYRLLERRGFSSDEVLQAIASNSNASSILTQLVTDAVNSSNIANWDVDVRSKKDLINRATDYARQGLWNAVGTGEWKYLTDSHGSSVALENLKFKHSRQLAQEEAERKAAEARAKAEDAIANRGESFLTIDGTLDSYSNTLKKLKVGTNGMSAKYYGKNGKANIMAVYREANRALTQAELAQAEAQANSETSAWVNKQMKGVSQDSPGYATKRQQVATDMERIRQQKLSSAKSAIAAQIREDAMKKHGVTGVIDATTYNVLTNIGYTGDVMEGTNGHLNWEEEFTPYLKKKAQSKMIYSTAMSKYDHPNTLISNTLGNWENNDSFSGRVYKLNANGTRGGMVEEYDDLDFSDTNKVSDILYSAEHPNKLIVQIGEGSNAERYIMDPSVLGENVAAFITQNGALLKKEADKTKGSVTITAGISQFLNAYNQVLGDTSSNK